MDTSLVKLVLPAALSFFVGVGLTPVLTHYFYKYKLWKKSSRAASDGISEAFQRVHSTKAEGSTPRFGGMIIWLAAATTTLFFYLLWQFLPSPVSAKLNFLSRSQTLIPLAALLFGSLIGLVDDILQVAGKGEYAKDDIRYRTLKVAIITIIGTLIGSWFHFKLGMAGISIPFGGELALGILFVPFFVVVMLAVFSTSVIDGIDGLSGGVLASIFGAYATIAFFNGQIDLAAFCAVVTGGILAFLWFNVPPARFYMGETGMLGLTVLLSVIAFLTDTVLIFPIIALPLVLTSLSVIVQMLSRRFRNGKRVFLVAPLHHHFEAAGWPPEKVVMRFWIISFVFAITGLIIAFIS